MSYQPAEGARIVPERTKKFMWSEDVVALMKMLEHEPENDPPHELSSAKRWTCKKCGHAGLLCDGNAYGGALEAYCGEHKVKW